MTVENKVERSLFNEVMVPCYNPMEMIPVKGEGASRLGPTRPRVYRLCWWYSCELFGSLSPGNG